MTNNKGFTLIELVSTFVIVTGIALIFINIVLIIKNIYSISDLRTMLLINQGNLSNQLNSKINKHKVQSVSHCNTYPQNANECYTFTYITGLSDNLAIGDDFISFGNYTYKLDNKSYIDIDSTSDVVSFDSDETYYNEDMDNSFMLIKISIKNDKYPDYDFGINLVYTFNSTTSPIQSNLQ